MSLKRPVILIENPKYPGNIGMVCRLIANFGLEPLRIIGKPIYGEIEMKWMASHSEEELIKIQYFQSIQEAVHDLEYLIGTGMIRGGIRASFIPQSDLGKILSEKRFGILFGREDRGLSRKAISYCDGMVDYQLPGYQKSMNLSHSVAYILALLNKEPEQKNENREIPRAKKHFYEFIKMIFGNLGMNEFQDLENLATRRFKSIIERSMPSAGDIDFLYKIFRRIEDKIIISEKDNEKK